MESVIEEEGLDNSDKISSNEVFKKPILIGKIGRLPKKLPFKEPEKLASSENVTSELNEPDTQEIIEQPYLYEALQQNQLQDRKKSSSPYSEPEWSGIPQSDGKDYSFDVLKEGSIIETINLMDKPFWIFGRLANCNIQMQHPTISRYHAVLQYRREASETDGPGFYIYDLGSTHGTFLNKNRLKPKVFVRIQVGHMLKLGCSSRAYILDGPEYDEEEESELSVTELKQKRDEEIRKLEEESLKNQKELEEKKKKEEERGVDWGLGEDADEETDLSENPFAQTNNEELYLDDPKKALRGFFEREGLDLEYDCSEQGIGQFLCKVELPVDDELGRPIIAEALHKGKKKEAVIQCALEACRILDRYGVLRQATHESRKRKSKNWEENDFYDSDEDTFLDRTGTIEKKREKRMNVKDSAKIETYDTMVEKEKTIAVAIKNIENKLLQAQANKGAGNRNADDEDTLDTYMKELSNEKSDKFFSAKLKAELTKLKAEHAKVTQLTSFLKPAKLPPLLTHQPCTSKVPVTSTLPLYGKRKKIQFKLERKSNYDLANIDNINDEDDDEEDDTKKITEENEMKQKLIVSEKSGESKVENNEQSKENASDSNSDIGENEYVSMPASNSTNYEEETRSSDKNKHLYSKMTFKKFEMFLKKRLLSYTGKYRDKFEEILNTFRRLTVKQDHMQIDCQKKKKLMKLISDMKSSESNEKLELEILSELDQILAGMNITEKNHKNMDEVRKICVSSNSDKMSNTCTEKHTDDYACERLGELETDNSEQNLGDDNSTDEKKKKKNQRRIHQRQGKQEQERQRGYVEDGGRENYNMWLPPSDQLGDGRTNLNDKFGY